jgi:serine/threonine-protein kinase RsbW
VSSGTWRGPGCRLFEASPAYGKPARDWITRIVSAHACPVDPQDAALVLSELFGNAVTYGPGGGRVLVAYLLWQDGARIVVCDRGGPTLPQLRDPSDLAEGGRGLQVVDALAARWGSFRAARAQVVWCDLGQPLPAATAEAWAWLNNLLAGSDLGPGPAEPRPTEASAARHAIPQPAGSAPSCTFPQPALRAPSRRG